MRQNRVHLMPPMSNFYARICVKATPSSNRRAEDRGKTGFALHEKPFSLRKEKDVLFVAAAGGKEFFLQGTRSAAPVRAPLVRQPREDGGTLKNLSGSGDGAGAHV